MPGGSLARGDIVIVMNQMMLQRVITQYETNFHDMRAHGVPPEVTVWIDARDELSVARTRKRIKEALPPPLRSLPLKVFPDPLMAPK